MEKICVPFVLNFSYSLNQYSAKKKKIELRQRKKKTSKSYIQYKYVEVNENKEQFKWAVQPFRSRLVLGNKD